jgi:hypothetical protein
MEIVDFTQTLPDKNEHCSHDGYHCTNRNLYHGKLLKVHGKDMIGWSVCLSENICIMYKNDKICQKSKISLDSLNTVLKDWPQSLLQGGVTFLWGIWNIQSPDVEICNRSKFMMSKKIMGGPEAEMRHSQLVSFQNKKKILCWTFPEMQSLAVYK